MVFARNILQYNKSHGFAVADVFHKTLDFHYFINMLSDFLSIYPFHLFSLRIC